MGKVSAFQIQFDGDREVYNSGDVIRGQVRLELQETKQFRGMYKQCGVETNLMHLPLCAIEHGEY